jgi:hypothetical protein
MSAIFSCFKTQQFSENQFRELLLDKLTSGKYKNVAEIEVLRDIYIHQGRLKLENLKLEHKREKELQYQIIIKEALETILSYAKSWLPQWFN